MSLRCWAGRNGSVLMNSPATGRQLYLAERSRRHLELMWRNVPDKLLLGQHIFLSIFKMKPSLQLLWGLADIPQGELMESARFQHHAKSFSMFLDIAVSKLKDESADLIALARNVGKRHTSYKRVSFDAEYWLLFKNSVIDHLEPYITPNLCTKAQGRNLWNKFLMYLIMEMKDAFYSELKRRHSSEDLTVLGTRNSLFVQLERHHRSCHSDGDGEDSSYVAAGGSTPSLQSSSDTAGGGGHQQRPQHNGHCARAAPVRQSTLPPMELLAEGHMVPMRMANGRSETAIANGVGGPAANGLSESFSGLELVVPPAKAAAAEYGFDEANDVWL